MPNKSWGLLSGLLFVDSLFFALYFSGQFFNLSLGKLFVLSSDWSYPEMFQYLKELSLLLLLLFRFLTHRKPLYLAWTMLFAYLLVDDALMIREWLGNLIAQSLKFELPFHLRGNDLGEFMALILFGGVLTLLLVLAHRSSEQTTQKLSWLLLPYLGLLILCGFVFDMVHSIFMARPGLEMLFGFLEDGGEMMVMSLTVWVVYRWFMTLPRVFRPRPIPLPDVASTHS
jgi:hypothetical protein